MIKLTAKIESATKPKTTAQPGTLRYKIVMNPGKFPYRQLKTIWYNLYSQRNPNMTKEEKLKFNTAVAEITDAISRHPGHKK